MPVTFRLDRPGPFKSQYVERPVGIVTDKALRVFIANISLDELENHGEHALRDELEQFGPIDRWTLFINRAGRYTGAGICTYRTAESAAECIKALNRRHNEDGTMLRVEQCREDGVELASTLQARDRELATLDDGGHWQRGRLPPVSTWRGGRGRGNTSGASGAARGGGHGGRGHGYDDTTFEDLDRAIAEYQREGEEEAGYQ